MTGFPPMQRNQLLTVAVVQRLSVVDSPGTDALRYAFEDLHIPKAFGAWLQVGDERFDSSEIQRLYEAEDYPLRKAD